MVKKHNHFFIWKTINLCYNTIVGGFMKKNYWKTILFVLFAFIPLTLFSTGCSILDTRGEITSIVKIGSEGASDFYKITYENGETETFTVKREGDETTNLGITVQEIYEEYKKVYGENLTFSEFVDKFLSIDNGEEGTTKAINKSLLSTALVYTEFYELDGMTKKNSLYSGSAVIWEMEDDYTYLVTNYHVVYSSKAYLEDNIDNFPTSINIYLYGSYGGASKAEEKDSNGYEIYNYYGSNISCSYVGGSVSTDLAIIKANTADIKKANPQACSVVLAETYHIGETAIAIGNAEGKGLSVTKGVVSVQSEEIKLDVDKARTYRELRIDTSIYHGNSGGGLFNNRGQLIGITNAGDGTDENINYAIPLNVVKGVVENLMYYCKNSASKTGSKVLLGVTVTSNDIRYSYNQTTGYGEIVEKIVVSEIKEGSIAEAMGLQEDDIIIGFKINDKEYSISRSYDLGDYLFNVRVNDDISIEYKRGETETFSNIYKVKVENLQNIE